MALVAPIEPPDRGPLLRAIGDGIHAFANVEFGLSCVFCVMIGSELGMPILAGARHFETRMRIVDAVADRALNQDDLSKATALFNRARKRSDMRNKLAHWQTGLWPPASTEAEARKMKWHLVPPASGMRLMELVKDPKSEGAQPISCKQIEDYATRCHVLATELFDLSQAIAPNKFDQGKGG